MYNSIVKTGKGTENANTELGLPGSTVKHLIDPFLNEEGTVHLNNWYIPPRLHTELHQRGTNTSGTV
jgi:hypothetical protein